MFASWKVKFIHIGLLSALISILVISYGCQRSVNQSNSDNRISVDSSKVKKTNIPGKSINAKGLNRMLSKNESFSVFIYEPSCPPCRKEISALNAISIKENLYSLDLTNVDVSKFTFIKPLNIQYTPTILKISKGKVISRTETFIGVNQLKKLKLFNPNFAPKEITQPKEYSNIQDLFETISLNDFQKKVSQNTNFIVYIGRPTCSDCQSFEKNFLNNGVSKYHKKVYYLNVDPLHKNYKMCQQFKSQNMIQGTPAFVSYQDGKLQSSSSWSISNGYSVSNAIEWLNAHVSK